MYDEQVLVDLIADKTGYSVELADDRITDQVRLTEPGTKIYVGHLGIKLQHPQTMLADGYIEIENPEILLTAIQFVCSRTDFVTVRSDIKRAYSGFSPFPKDSDYSSLVFLEAKTIATTNNKIWWQEVIGLVMPRVS